MGDQSDKYAPVEVDGWTLTIKEHTPGTVEIRKHRRWEFDLSLQDLECECDAAYAGTSYEYLPMPVLLAALRMLGVTQ